MPGWFTSLHPAVQVAFIIACVFIVPPMTVLLIWVVVAILFFFLSLIAR